MATLADIQTKVRRIVRAPTEAQLSTANLNAYINNFILYDFPEALRIFAFRKTLTFWTQPNQDTYTTTNANVNDPLYNFQNVYTSIHDPIYIAGYRAWYSQSREDFFAQWPFLNFDNQETTGNGIANAFAGVLTNAPVLQNNVTFSSIDANNNGLIVEDQPISNSLGNLLIPSTGANVGQINYVTGAYNFTFPAAPGNDVAIFSQTVPYVANRPTAILYYDYTFTLRPVPDISYPVQMEVYQRPTQLINTGDVPQLETWWQYIALGAAKKIFEDRTEYENVQMIMQTFKEQESFCLRSTLVQQDHERAATIYSQQASLSAGPWGSQGNSFFNF